MKLGSDVSFVTLTAADAGFPRRKMDGGTSRKGWGSANLLDLFGQFFPYENEKNGPKGVVQSLIPPISASVYPDLS